MVSDLVDIDSYSPEFTLGKPFHPFEQVYLLLISVFVTTDLPPSFFLFFRRQAKISCPQYTMT